MSEFICPLCAGLDHRAFFRDARRAYWRCAQCALVFVPPAWHLTAEAERAEYDKHQNFPDDPGYRRFLGRLAEPLLARLPANATGLDFGCGPGPALAQMLCAAGHQVALYDIYYQPDARVLTAHYDFIVATEVIEHLSAPGVELARLWAQLRPGGILGLMTKLVIDQTAFAHWHYKNDPTHISFFSEPTFLWLANTLGARWERVAADVVLLHKPASLSPTCL